MVQGQHFLMFGSTIIHIANVCEYKILHFGPIRRNIYQMLIPAKIVTLIKVLSYYHIYPTHPCILGNNHGLTMIFTRKYH